MINKRILKISTACISHLKRKGLGSYFILNKDIALKVAKEIDKIVEGLKQKGEVILVFEKLTGLRARKGKWKKLNKKLNYWLRRVIVEKVYKVDEIYPQYTSKSVVDVDC